MLKSLKSLLRSLAKADRLDVHWAELQQSGKKALFVRPKVSSEVSRAESSRSVQGPLVVGTDYLMTSGDDVDAVYYLGGAARNFLKTNAYFTGLGAIRQYTVKFGKVFLFTN
jgi:hypothetical protein